MLLAVMCSNENAKPAMILIKKRLSVIYFFSFRWNVSNFMRPISFRIQSNHLCNLNSISRFIDHFYGLSSVFNAKVVSFIITTTYF